MKRLLLILTLVLMAFPVFAQGVSIEPDSIFVSFSALAAAIPLIVEAVKGMFNPPKGLWTQVVSWITGVAVTMFGWWLSLGFLDGLIWWNALIIGVFASMVANGLSDTGFYIWLLKRLGILKK